MEKRVALVMGNAKYVYQHNLMHGPTNNVRRLKRKLEQLGFEVLSDTNCTRSRMLELEQQFREKLAHSDVGLFYFCGHGLEHNGVIYFTPSDDPQPVLPEDVPEQERWMRDHFISFQKEHLAWVSRYEESKVNICILDCCRSDPLRCDMEDAARGKKPVFDQFSGENAPHGTLLAYATSPLDTATGLPFSSVYTRALLKWIDRPGLTVEEMFKRAREDVLVFSEQIHRVQIAWDHSSIVGSFCLNPVQPDGKCEYALVPDGEPAEDAPEPVAGVCPFCGAPVEIPAGAPSVLCPFCRRAVPGPMR